ncbi:unnamed protein product, partial [Notodromas monacha]
MVAQNSARFLVRLMARRRRTFLIIIPVNILIVWVLYNGWAVGDRSIIRWSFLMDRTFFRNSIPGFVTSRKHDKPTGTVLAILPSVNAEIPFNAEYILHDVLGHTIHQCTHSLTLPPKDCQMATGKCWDHLLLWPGDFKLANSIPNWGLHKCPNASVSSFPELKETLLSRPILKQLRQANGVLKSFHFPNETEEAEFHFAGKFLTIFKSTGQSKERPKLMERVVNGKPWRDTWETASGLFLLANFLVDILGDVHLMDVRAAEPFAKNEKLATLHEFYQLIGMDKYSCPSDFRDQLEAFCPPECRQNF